MKDIRVRSRLGYRCLFSHRISYMATPRREAHTRAAPAEAQRCAPRSSTLSEESEGAPARLMSAGPAPCAPQATPERVSSPTASVAAGGRSRRAKFKSAMEEEAQQKSQATTSIDLPPPVPEKRLPPNTIDLPPPPPATDLPVPAIDLPPPAIVSPTTAVDLSAPLTENDQSAPENATADQMASIAKKTKKQNRKNRKQKQKGASKEQTEVGRRNFHQFKFRVGNRKRSQSFPAAAGKFFLPYKRPRNETIIPPTKFLLGGNISDPLNLNSLRDEDVNRAMNAVTPKSSPLPTPPRHKAKVDVIIPPNIRDPLNLLTPLDNDEYEKQLETAKPRRARKRTKSNRRRHSESGTGVVTATETTEITAGGAVPARSPPAASPASPARPSAPTDPPPTRKRPPSESEPPLPAKEIKKPRRQDPLDKIVSPVVPQPGSWMRIHPRGKGHKPTPLAALPPEKSIHLPSFRKKDTRYQFGNYDRYYGYRNLNALMDVRLKVFELNRHLFNNKDILDIGCNVGHISIAVARDFGAKSVTGIDIDNKLIARARKNVSQFVVVKASPAKDKEQDKSLGLASNMSMESVDPNLSTNMDDKNILIKEEPPTPILSEPPGASQLLPNRPNKKRNRRAHHKPAQDLIKHYYPISCPILYGPTEVIGFPVDDRGVKYPQNIVFKQANYILKDENLINAELPQYDLILCLSVTKWFHLNWGDAGIKLAFKRMFAQLRPGGKLILEAQSWASYKKKKSLTETIYKNFQSIEFFPGKFKEYLLSPEVGFSKCYILGVPQHLSKGFRRPIHLYIKGDFTPSKVQWSDTYAPSHHQSDLSIDEQPKKVYAYVGYPSYHPSSSRLSDNNTPSYGAVTPCALQLENNSTEESPFYNPRSDSYLPSYSSSGQPKTVYASLSSPQSEGGTPSHVSEGASVHGAVYATMVSPASPFLEPSPGNSTTPSHPFTPSHSASYDVNPANKKVYASLHSPHEDVNGRGQPVYSPSVAGTSRCGGSGGHSPLYTGSSLRPEFENANSNDSTQVKSVSDHLTPAASPSSDVQNAAESEHNSPKDSNDTE